MGKIIRITESQFEYVVKNMVKKTILLKEGKPRGFYKPLWTKDDQILALYIGLYGDNKLSLTTPDIAARVIGTSPDSLRTESKNYTPFIGEPGLRRKTDVPLQVEVFKDYGKLPETILREICNKIIEHGLENPNEYVKKYELGNLIGNERENVEKERNRLLKLKGVTNPKKFKLLSTRPKYQPLELNDGSEKNDFIKFLTDVYSKFEQLTKNNFDKNLQSIESDIEFMIDYLKEDSLLDLSEIENELTPKKQEFIKFLEDVYNKTKQIRKDNLEKYSHTIKSDIEFMIDYLKEDIPLTEQLTYDEFKNNPRLEALRNAIDNNKIVGVAFVKPDNSVRAMCFRKYLKSYVASETQKTEKQISMGERHNQISVVDLNIYNKLLRETGNSETASKSSWRKITLPNVLGFIAGSTFIDLRGPEDNNILERFGEDVYNSLTKSMINAIELNHEENVEIDVEGVEHMDEPEVPEDGDGVLNI